MNPDGPGARILAENVGFEIVEVDGRVWFFNRRSRGPALVAMIGGGVAAVTLINAVLQTFGQLTGAELGAGWLGVLILLGLAVLGALVCTAALRLRRSRLDCPRAELRPLLMVDRQAQTLIDGDGQVIAPIAEVRGARGMPLGSSAPAVFIEAPGRFRVEVFRGSLIGGGIDPALEALAELGFSR